MKLYAIVKTDNEGFTNMVISVEKDFIKAQKILERRVTYRLNNQIKWPNESWKYDYYCALIEYNSKWDKKLNMIHEAGRLFKGKNITEINIIEKA